MLTSDFKREIVGIIQDLYTNLVAYSVHRHTDPFWTMDGHRKQIIFIKKKLVTTVKIVNSLDNMDDCIKQDFEYKQSIWDLTNSILLFIEDNI